MFLMFGIQHILPFFFLKHMLCPGKGQLERPGRALHDDSARVVEIVMGQDHDIDVFPFDAELLQFRED